MYTCEPTENESKGKVHAKLDKVFYLPLLLCNYKFRPSRGVRVFNWARKFPGYAPTDTYQPDFALDVIPILILLKKAVEEKTTTSWEIWNGTERKRLMCFASVSGSPVFQHCPVMFISTPCSLSQGRILFSTPCICWTDCRAYFRHWLHSIFRGLM